MDITWLGHSCFRLRSGDVSIITDPYSSSLGLDMGSQQADAVTVSHDHPHHAYSEGISGDPRVLSGPGEYELSGVYITGVMTPPSETDPEGKRNTAYLIEMERVRLCHLGNVSSTLTSRQAEELTPMDVLFLPVGGGSTISTSQAAVMIHALEPRIVVPMHYSIPGMESSRLSDLEPFMREMSLRETQPQNRLNVTATNLPAELRVAVLERRV